MALSFIPSQFAHLPLEHPVTLDSRVIKPLPRRAHPNKLSLSGRPFHPLEIIDLTNEDNDAVCVKMELDANYCAVASSDVDMVDAELDAILSHAPNDHEMDAAVHRPKRPSLEEEEGQQQRRHLSADQDSTTAQWANLPLELVDIITSLAAPRWLYVSKFQHALARKHILDTVIQDGRVFAIIKSRDREALSRAFPLRFYLPKHNAPETWNSPFSQRTSIYDDDGRQKMVLDAALATAIDEADFDAIPLIMNHAAWLSPSDFLQNMRHLISCAKYRFERDSTLYDNTLGMITDMVYTHYFETVFTIDDKCGILTAIMSYSESGMNNLLRIFLSSPAYKSHLQVYLTLIGEDVLTNPTFERLYMIRHEYGFKHNGVTREAIMSFIHTRLYNMATVCMQVYPEHRPSFNDLTAHLETMCGESARSSFLALEMILASFTATELSLKFLKWARKHMAWRNTPFADEVVPLSAHFIKVQRDHIYNRANHVCTHLCKR